MIKKVDYSEVKDSFIVTFGKCGKKPRVGISPIGIWIGHGHPEVIINGNDNTIPPLGVLRWEWIKRIEISDISKDGYGFIILVFRDFDAVMNTISYTLPIKTAYLRLGNEGKVLAMPGHICFDFNGDDYNSFIDTITQNNFVELNFIGHIEEKYKLTTGQKAWNTTSTIIIIIVLIVGFISLILSFI